MRRNVSLEEISDGRLYCLRDMVKADCHGCRGCSKCCRGMGNSVVLDPYDIYRLQAGVHRNAVQLLQEGRLELHVVDGCILPNLNMSGEGERCTFLGADGRCSIHGSRPGICRLFPLGRYYENGDFKYFLQVGECSEKNRTKVKVEKWIDTPDPQRNHDFICAWHELLKAVEKAAAGNEDSVQAKSLNMELLNNFFLTEYNVEEDFYGQFYERLSRYRGQFCIKSEG